MKNLIITIYTLLICLLCSADNTFGQVEMQGSQFIFDKTYINPSFSGINGGMTANLHYQLNDAGQHAGKSYTISAAANIAMKQVKSGLGVNVVRNVFGNDSYTMGYGNYVYHLPVSPTTVLSSGISLGIQQFDINLSNLTTVVQNDPLAARNIYSSKLDARFGLTGTFNNKFYLGASFDNILSLYTKKDDYYNQIPPTFRKINMYLIAGANLMYESGIQMQPSILFMKNFGGITSLDVNAMLTFDRSISFGVGFRQRIEESQSVALNTDDRSISQSILRPMIQYQVNKANQAIKIGYCYSFNAGNSMNVGSKGSHDLTLIYELPK
uniref:PorP/SprF family type IX secretion system membrane protein n=1 Tax=Pedobacter schmidteae TaxID=2201271 RepID=UPI000EAF856D|nr:PorP/SprF family type IX secretion system membrane protein [Pedobacter schmidteae]